jgi:hypothetical protein
MKKGDRWIVRSAMRPLPLVILAAWNISARYGTFHLPETYIIDRSGKVLEKIIAAHDFMEPDLLARVQRQLKQVPK